MPSNVMMAASQEAHYTHIETDINCRTWTSPEMYKRGGFLVKERGSPWRWPSAELPGGYWLDGLTPG